MTAPGPRALPGLALRCRGLVKHYDGGKVVAVDGLDLDVERGECFGLLGPNGAGKTTTVEILEGLVDATAGEVAILGLRWAHDERALREKLGVSLQQTHLPDRLTVAEVVVGLALVILLYRRHGDTQVGLASEMKG